MLEQRRRLKKDTDKTKYFSSSAMSLSDTRPSGPVSFIQGHQLLGLEQGGDLYYYVTDGLSSVRVIVDDSGSVVDESMTDEFGRPETSLATAGLSAHTYVGGLGYRNETAGTGLYYVRQRWYDPALGKFISQDPIGFAGGLNLYEYTASNPVSAVDPSGMWVQLYFKSGRMLEYDNDHFADAIHQIMAARPGSIESVHFIGHAGPPFITCGTEVTRGPSTIDWNNLTYTPGPIIDWGNGWIDANTKIVYAHFEDSQGKHNMPIADIFRGKKVKSIVYRGCNTAGGIRGAAEMRRRHPGPRTTALYPDPTENNLARRTAHAVSGAKVTGSVGPYWGGGFDNPQNHSHTYGPTP